MMYLPNKLWKNKAHYHLHSTSYIFQEYWLKVIAIKPEATLNQ